MNHQVVITPTGAHGTDAVPAVRLEAARRFPLSPGEFCGAVFCGMRGKLDQVICLMTRKNSDRLRPFSQTLTARSATGTQMAGAMTVQILLQRARPPRASFCCRCGKRGLTNMGDGGISWDICCILEYVTNVVHFQCPTLAGVTINRMRSLNKLPR